GFPEIPQPTGLPSVAAKAPVPATALPKGNAPEMPGASGSRASPAPTVHHEVAQGPVPGAQLSTAVSAAPAKDSGSWWSWLTSRVHSFLGSVPTSDPGVTTSAGPRAAVDTSG